VHRRPLRAQEQAGQDRPADDPLVVTDRRGRANLRGRELGRGRGGRFVQVDRATVFSSSLSSSSRCTRGSSPEVSTHGQIPVTVAITSPTGPGRTSSSGGHRCPVTGTATVESSRRPSTNRAPRAMLWCSSQGPATRSRQSKARPRLRRTERRQSRELNSALGGPLQCSDLAACGADGSRGG
jgi:hypothetical protein